ncbi:hypothetical protein ACFRCI_47200 [Streptomyces sp. NPDC056638]|uniref:hypothetical protein n=1 Tax=Streptomyces sp. NPDC056638 TaxID=3345887 RepID=UPI00369A8181
MWHDLLSVQVPIAEKVLRTVGVYALIVILFRLSGKRGLANLNTFDFVVIFLLSNVVQNAVIGNDNSLLGGAIGATTLVAVTDFGVSGSGFVSGWVTRSVRAGTPEACGIRTGAGCPPSSVGAGKRYGCGPLTSSMRAWKSRASPGSYG